MSISQMASHNEAGQDAYVSEKPAPDISASLSIQVDPGFHSQHEKPATTNALIPDDVELNSSKPRAQPQSMFKSLGILDSFLAVWIFLAMAVGIILGALVPSVGPALQKGEFVGVSVPIGML